MPQMACAFPMQYSNGAYQTGMAMRDWFAGMALQGAITCCQNGTILAAGPHGIAKTAYEIADAMIAERDK